MDVVVARLMRRAEGRDVAYSMESAEHGQPASVERASVVEDVENRAVAVI